MGEYLRYNHPFMQYTPPMEEFLNMLERRIDDHMHQLRIIGDKISDISTEQAVFKEHHKRIESMYESIQNAVSSILEDIRDIRSKINHIQNKQDELEQIEIRRSQIWRGIVRHKTWAVVCFCVGIFVAGRTGEWLLNHEPPGKRSIPTELYDKVMQ